MGSNELHPLCEAAIEERLTPEQHGRLEQLVLEHPEARRFYVEYMHQHASLRWSVAEPDFLRGWLRTRHRDWRSSRPAGSDRLGVTATPALRLGLRGGGRPARSGDRAGPAFRGASSAQPPAPFASLAEVKGCKWDGGTLPTEAGARLGTGRLRLAEGLARIIFDHGAEITLEAPADLELRSAQYCVLRGGRLVANVPPPAVGFTVETPTAVLNDLGTEFGVNVHEAGTSDVQVFRGLVDVRHRASGKTEHMTTGHIRRFGAVATAEFDPLAEVPPDAADQPAAAEGPAGRVVQISTALGRGKDAYIQPKYPSEHHSDILLLVKYSASTTPNYERKAYIGMDLASIAGMDVVDARLSLTFAPTGMGYSSEVPDATFAVFGLTDEALDDWDEETIRWNDAPANFPGGASLDPSKVVRLGTFTIGQGELTGTRSIEGKALTDFLNRDTNGLATFIVVRETQGSGRTTSSTASPTRTTPTCRPRPSG